MKCALLIGIALMFPAMPALSQAPEELTKDRILAAGPQWQEKYEQYDPPAETLELLKSRLAGLKIDVYLGLWCPDSRNNLPPFIKILDRLAAGVPVRYFGVPRKPSRDVKYYVVDMAVERVPSFIFYRDGKEIGRIIENPKTGMVEDFMDIVCK